MSRPMYTPAQAARISAGFTLEGAAKRLRVAPSTLRRYERTTPPMIFAERAAQLFRCRIDVFIHTTGGGKPTGSHSAGERSGPDSALPESPGDALAAGREVVK